MNCEKIITDINDYKYRIDNYVYNNSDCLINHFTEIFEAIGCYCKITTIDNNGIFSEIKPISQS